MKPEAATQRRGAFKYFEKFKSYPLMLGDIILGNFAWTYVELEKNLLECIISNNKY